MASISLDRTAIPLFYPLFAMHVVRFVFVRCVCVLFVSHRPTRCFTDATCRFNSVKLARGGVTDQWTIVECATSDKMARESRMRSRRRRISVVSSDLLVTSLSRRFSRRDIFVGSFPLASLRSLQSRMIFTKSSRCPRSHQTH